MVVLEAEDQVGGIAKTAVRDGYRFDLGGHRFFTKVKEVDDLWHEIMREEFLERPRMSRIYWRDRKGRAKFLDYPLRGPDVMKKLGPVDLTKALFSYLWAAVKPKGKEDDLRGVGREPLRPVALQPVLQVVHGEGLGRADVRDPRRLGRPADQEPLVLPRRLVSVLRQQGQQGHEPDLEVQLPPLRPRPDVGDDDRRHPEARRPGAPEPQGHPARLRGRPLRARARGRQGLRAVGRGLVAAAAERRRHGEPAPEPRGDRRGEGDALPRLPHGGRGARTARTSSRTTGSTSTTRT